MTDVERFVGAALPPLVVVVERGPVTAFAAAVTDTHPVRRDRTAAVGAGFDDVVAPPTWPLAMHHWGAFPEHQPDGADAADPMWAFIDELTADGGLVLHGEQEFVHHRPIVVGDELTRHGAIEDVWTKEGSSGTMTFARIRADWHDTADALVVTETRTIIVTSAGPGGQH